MSADECKQILTKSIERREEDNELRKAKNAAAANGEAIGEELLKHAVPELAQLGLDAERIAAILDLELEAVRNVMGEDKEDLVG